MFHEFLRAVGRQTADFISHLRAAPAGLSERQLDAGPQLTSPDREAIEARVFNLVLFLRGRPCGPNGLGSVDRCGRPNPGSRCGVHSIVEQVGADVASLLDQLEQAQRLLGPHAEELSSPGFGRPEPESVFTDEVALGEVGQSGEFVISETIKLTQKMRMPGQPPLR